MSGHFQPRQFEVVLGAILTQNSSWTNAEKALRQLVQENLLDAYQIASCPLSQLERTVRSSGFFRQKAHRLKMVSCFILNFPRDFYCQVKRDELLSISGIGAETADSILLYACDQPHFVVDAYTRRVFTRYGLLDEEADYDDVKTFFQSSLPKDVRLYKHFHALIVELAKQTCKKRPHCDRCVLATPCRSGAITLISKEKQRTDQLA